VHKEFAHNGAIDIPGPEADRLVKLAKTLNVFIL